MHEFVEVKVRPPVTGWFESWAADGQVISAFSNSCMGVSCTTETHLLRCDGCVEARVGFAIMGPPMMTEAEFAACEYNPFHPDFRDNYAAAKGATDTEACAALAKELKSISDGLWAEF